MATLHVQGNPTIINMDEPEKSSKDESITDDFMYGSNVASAHIYIRMGFLRKVYGILCTQLLITAAYAYMCFKFEPLEQFYKNNPWMLFVVMILSFVFLIALHVKAQQTPINFILLGLFTLCEASLIGCVVTMYDGFIVIEAALITFAVTLGLTLYTFQSKRDFSKMGSTLIVLLMMLIMVSFLQIFFRAAWMDLGIAVVGAVIFSAFIIYDTHLLMHRLSPEEYMTASVNLYLDIINLFLYILRILNAAKK